MIFLKNRSETCNGNRKKIDTVLAVVLCALLCMGAVTGCSKDKVDDSGKNAVSALGNHDTAQQSEGIEDGVYIMLYMLNEDSWETEIDADTGDADEALSTTVVAEISEKELNAKTIADKYNEIVVQSLYGDLFTINDVTKVDNKVIVDFDSNSVKAVEITEGEEGQLFYNMARSIEENLGDVNYVYLTMDGGKDFRLGHLWFEAAQPFYSGREAAE